MHCVAADQPAADEEEDEDDEDDDDSHAAMRSAVVQCHRARFLRRLLLCPCHARARTPAPPPPPPPPLSSLLSPGCLTAISLRARFKEGALQRAMRRRAHRGVNILLRHGHQEVFVVVVVVVLAATLPSITMAFPSSVSRSSRTVPFASRVATTFATRSFDAIFTSTRGGEGAEAAAAFQEWASESTRRA